MAVEASMVRWIECTQEYSSADRTYAGQYGCIRQLHDMQKPTKLLAENIETEWVKSRTL